MTAFWHLFKLDSLAFRDWFAKQTISKVIVALAYLLVLFGVALGVYFWSDSFFKYVAPFESYGRLTSIYILRGAFILLVWVGILSSIITTATFLLTADKHQDLLLTFPIRPLYLSLRRSAGSLMLNLSLFLISVFPLSLAYTHRVGGPILSLLIIGLLTQALGSSIGYLLVYFLHKKHGLLYGMIFGIFILLTTFLLLRMIFPLELKLLADIPAESFSALYSNLPLIKDCWLSGALVGVSTGSYMSSLPVFPVTALLVLIAILIQMELFIPCWQAQKVHLSTMKKPRSGLGLIHRIGPVTKDLLSIFRNPRDIGYLLFLLAMIVAFFGLFGQGYLARSIPDRFRGDALAFSFAWLIFFTGTYLVRLAYPLMVNEGQSRWWFFTRPLTPQKALFSKILTGLLLSLPLVLLAGVEWLFLPFTIDPVFFALVSLNAISFLAIIVPLLGSFNRDFTLAYEPERASTSLTGLLAIVFVFITGALGTYLISLTLKQSLEPGLALSALLTYALVAGFGIWFLAVHSLRHLTLDL